MDDDERGFSTRAIHDADLPREIGEQPLAPPIYLTADYLYEGLEHYADVINERRPGYVYGRYGGPTHVALHKVLASLDDAEAAWSFASGMAALHTALTMLARAGQHLVVNRTVYGGTYALLTSVFPGYGIEVTFAEPEADEIGAAIRDNTAAVLVETLANPTFRVADVEGIAALCAERNVPLVVDNTVASPYLLRPLRFPGVSLVMHSTSKYIGGHSDLIGGSVAGPRSLVDGLRHLSMEQGTTAGAFDAWLALRGVQTLGLRMARQCANALELATFLAAHDRVERVHYSGLPNHPDHDRAGELFRDGYGAMLAFEAAGGYEGGVAICDALRVARVGSSFGGVRSEVTHPASTSHRQFPPEERRAAGIGDALIRVSVGAEDMGDLIADFDQALGKP